MTEWEKAQSGLLYDANYEPKLLAWREQAAEMCFDYNALRPSQSKEKDELLTKIVGAKGCGCTIISPFYCDYGFNVFLGDNVFLNYNCVILDAAPVRFGNNVFVAPNVGFYTAGHPFDVEQRNKGLEYAKEIVIEDDVWIGAGAQICPGIRIGRGSTIGAGSIVTKDIPPNVLAAGNPCRVIRELN